MGGGGGGGGAGGSSKWICFSFFLLRIQIENWK